MELSIIIPTINEGENIGVLIPKIKDILFKLGLDFEIIVIDGGSGDDTVYKAKTARAIVQVQENPGYGNSLKEGFSLAKGDYIVTMDGDFSHKPSVIIDLWKHRKQADIIIASRYVDGGKADISIVRRLLSVLLNKFFSFGLSVPLRDLSSGFRLYNRATLKEIEISGENFDALQEILVKAYSNGRNIKEIPFYYKQRKSGRSKLRLIKFGNSYIKTFYKLWLLRN